MIDWPFGELILNEYEYRSLLPPSRIVILYEIYQYYVAVSKSATIINQMYPSLPIRTSLVNETEIKWLSLKNQPVRNLAKQLRSHILLVRVAM